MVLIDKYYQILKLCRFFTDFRLKKRPDKQKDHRSFTEMVFIVVSPGGFEPPAHSLEGCCSIQLSYGPTLVRMTTTRIVIHGAGDGNRTHVISLEGWSSTIELHPHGASA